MVLSRVHTQVAFTLAFSGLSFAIERPFNAESIDIWFSFENEHSLRTPSFPL